MRALSHMTLRLFEPPAVEHRSFISSGGEALAWVDVADGELSIYGAPDTLRRLAAALVVAADAAETLAERRPQPVTAAVARVD